MGMLRSGGLLCAGASDIAAAGPFPRLAVRTKGSIRLMVSAG